jgi:drug/metabolite transporter (DMT)-like permease
MDVRRLRASEWLAAAAGVALIVSLFLPWYDDVSGFAAMSIIDVLLVLVAAVGITLAILQATRTTPALPVAFGVLTVVTGAIGVLLVLFRLIDSPGDVGGPATGAWLGLVAAVALTAGGWTSLANEHVRHLPPGPEPELRPAPGS